MKSIQNKPTPPKSLIQVWVLPSVKYKFGKLAKAAGRSEADYLRQLIKTHVGAVTPRLIKALSSAWKGLKPGDGEVKQLKRRRPAK